MFDVTPLARVTDFYGNSALIEDDPMCVCHRDVLCVPAGTPGTSPGLFDRGRKMLPAAADHRAQPHPQPFHDAFTTLDPERFDYASDDAEYVFLGTLTGHYGHFITASLSRLWVARLAPDVSTRYVILNQQSAETFFEIAFISEILTAAGVTPGNIVSFSRPVRFRRITVPSPAIEEHNFSHRVFGNMCARIGDLLVPERSAANDTPVFLSKDRLAAGVSRVVNEAELCDHLAHAGVEIVHPETMSLPEQIALFRSRSAVSGLAGSGLHTSVFAPNRDKLALTLSPHLLTNQLLLDQVSGGTTATYIAESTREPDEANWQSSFRLTDPARAAAAFLDLIDRDLRPRAERRRRSRGTPLKLTSREIGCFRFEQSGRSAGHLARFRGWCSMEPQHCWTSGVSSYFDLALLPSEGNLTLSLLIEASLAQPHLVSRPLVVYANDIAVADFLVSRMQTHTCAIPRRCLAGSTLSLRFDHPVTASPRDLGVAEDPRDVSICFKQIAVHEAA